MPISRLLAAGGLLSYGIAAVKYYHRIGTCAGKILKAGRVKLSPSHPWRLFGSTSAPHGYARSTHKNKHTASKFLCDIKISHRNSDRYNEEIYSCRPRFSVRAATYFSTGSIHCFGYPTRLCPSPLGTSNSKKSPRPPAPTKASKFERL
jgi:hypothetical protein